MLVQFRGREPLVAENELGERLRIIGKQLPNHEHLETRVLFPWISRTLKEDGFMNDGLFW